MAYVDRSPDASKTCQRCAQWQPPAGTACGGCKLVRGPIHPDGTCKLFAPAS